MGLGAAAISAVTTVAGFLGAGAGLADTIGAIGGPALLGAGAGAVTGAVTHGNILEDAALGGLTAGAGAAAPLAAPALGITSATGIDALGAGAGALTGGALSAATGNNPLTGAIAGGLAGFGGASASQGPLAGLGPDGSAATGAAGTGSTGTLPSSNNPFGNVTSDAAGGASSAAQAPSGGSTYGPTSAFATNPSAGDDSLNPQSSASASGNSSGSGSGGSGGGGSGTASKGLSPNLLYALAGINALSSMINKPQQAPYGNTPGPAQAAANLGPYYNQPLGPVGSGVTPTAPAVNYYTYGQGPEQTFFTGPQGNSLAAYGFARGGALSGEFMTSHANTNRVRGPGGPKDDLIPAALSNGEYVLTAKEVSDAGGGSNEAGARKIDHARKTGALSKIIRRAAA